MTYSAGLLGAGSEVLGYDTEQSTDHDWGPRLMLLLSDTDHAQYANAIRDTLNRELPKMFRGYPVFCGSSSAPDQVVHHIEVLTLRNLLNRLLGIEPEMTLSPADWLTFPQQRLLELTAGRVFHDGLGTLEPLRARFAYYPQDVWLYILAAQWRRIEQEEPFMGRAGFVGDELGSSVIAARRVNDIMRLAFLMEKRYAPYAKWFGSAFAQLSVPPKLKRRLQAALRSESWQECEHHLSVAYMIMAERHNRLGITELLPTVVTPFFDRPYMVIHGDVFCRAIREQIKDEQVRKLPPFLGSIDQFTNSTDVTYPAMFRQFTRLYETP